MEIKIQAILLFITAVACIAAGDVFISCFFLCGCIALLFGMNVWTFYRREKRLEELISYLMKVQDGLELPALAECREGQFGILQSEIYKLVVLLKEQLGSANREKKYLADMLSDISHQIKTPLTAITIMTDLLKQTDLPMEKRIEFVEKIDRQVAKIIWLIRNLLTLSQLEADVLKLRKESVEIYDLLRAVCQSLELLAEVKGVELVLQKPEEKIVLDCDRAWTSEAFSNIIKNCIEHTPEGGRVFIHATQNNFGTSVTIEDNGNGIAKEDLPHIFERFYRGKHASKESVGIGLALAKQIILRQDGTIHIQSVEGEGSTFLVRLYMQSRDKIR